MPKRVFLLGLAGACAPISHQAATVDPKSANSAANMAAPAAAVGRIGKMLTTYVFANEGSGTLNPGYTAFGFPMLEGELTEGMTLAAEIGGRLYPIQTTVKARWPDGSARHAICIVQRPAGIARGGKMPVTVKAATPVPAKPVDLSTSLNGKAFYIDLTWTYPAGLASSGTVRYDLREAIRGAVQDGTIDYWFQGPLATCGRASVLVPDSSFRFVVDCTAYANGDIEWDVVFANDRAMEANGGSRGRVTYGAVISLNGSPVLTEAVNHWQYQSWHRNFVDGNSGTQALQNRLNIQHVPQRLISSKMVLRCDLTLDFSAGIKYMQQALDGAHNAVPWTKPLAGYQGIEQYMPMGGIRPDLGPMPTPYAIWAYTSNFGMARLSMMWAECSLYPPWNLWDQHNSRWISLDNYPKLWVDPDGNRSVPDSMPNGQPGNPDARRLLAGQEYDHTKDAYHKWWLDSQHRPQLEFLPYILTGKRWIYDALMAHASFLLMYSNPWLRQERNGRWIFQSAIRAAAWTGQTIGDAAWVAAHGSYERKYFNDNVSGNWLAYADRMPEVERIQGEIHGWVIPPTFLVKDWGFGNHITVWQQDYFNHVNILHAQRWGGNAQAVLDWAVNFICGRFEQGATFPFRSGVAYNLAVAAPGSSSKDWSHIHKTWAGVAASQRVRVRDGVAGADWHPTSWRELAGDPYARYAASVLGHLWVYYRNRRAKSVYDMLIASNPPGCGITGDRPWGSDPQFGGAVPGQYATGRPWDWE